MKGTVLEERYRIEKILGKGGFGEVYKAFDLNLKRTVAVKILSSVEIENSFKDRFYREAESLARMNHPNIVTIFDRGDYNHRPYLVMEFVDGPTLHQMVMNTSLNLNQIRDIAEQICEAMSYAHGLGIVHRDITLKNIMLNEEEENDIQVKILDFGLVKLIDSQQTTGNSMMGTRLFMAPEQVIGGSVDGRADIFAFGVSLYRILTGHFPFEAEHPAALMYTIVNEEPKQFSREIPEDLRLITLKCLEKDPRNRYRLFSEVLEDFKSVGDCKLEAHTQSTTSFVGLDAFVERSSKRNPYLNRVMLNNPNDFFGRKREIRRIYSRMDAPHPQSISIVGDRRIGKSSLLNFIYNRKNRKRNMQNYEKSVFVYLDFQKSIDFDVPKFVDFVLTVFGYETERGRKYAKLDKTLDQFKNVIEELHEEGRRIILLMDEFEIITRNEKFEAEFFSFLRSMANSYRVAYVTSSCGELQRMCHNQDISDSPFFNIFSNLPLRMFSREEALELITVPSETEGIPLAKYADNILQLSGLFPLYIQIASSILFEHFVDNPDDQPDWDQITKSYNDEVSPHYSFIWDRMTEDEKKNLTRISRGKNIDRKHQFINEELIRRGYLEESGGQIEIFSRVFQDFIIGQMEKSRPDGSIFSSIFNKLRGK